MSANEVRQLNRRAFFSVVALASGGVAFGFVLPATPLSRQETFEPNAWIKITEKEISIVVGQSEMGQGVLTALPMLVAEELEVTLEQINVKQGLAKKAFFTADAGEQTTGASDSVNNFWQPLREAGARAREMLIQSAANIWSVEPSSCYAKKGIVHDRLHGRKLRYQELVSAVVRIPIPEHVKLKTAKDFQLIGTPVKRVDIPAKVLGKAAFGIDTMLPGLKIASVVHCPTVGGQLRSFSDREALLVPGVIDVLRVNSRTVAVVADNYWAARKGCDALHIDWDEGPFARLDDAALERMFVEAASQPGLVAEDHGNARKIIADAKKVHKAVYQVPYLAHATMEPQNCTVRVHADRCEVWAPTQVQTRVQKVASEITGLDPSQVIVHTPYLGGGFGRRLEVDYVEEAVRIAHKLKRPIKLIWSREDDTRNDFYRPRTYNELSAVLDSNDRLIAWSHHIVAQSIYERWAKQYLKPNGRDPSCTGGAIDSIYKMPNRYVDCVQIKTPIDVGFWRSVGNSQNAFITESFINELATAANVDPITFRLSMLKRGGRASMLLESIARHSKWGRPLPLGHAQGVAIHRAFGSLCAQVVELSIHDNIIHVHTVHCAIDCGQIVNPDTVRAQLEGGVVFALSATLYDEISIDKGGVVQGNFNDYRMLRIHESPRIHTYIEKSDKHPGGVGELGVPPLAPAVANAVFRLTGQPVRRLPIRLS